MRCSNCGMYTCHCISNPESLGVTPPKVKTAIIFGVTGQTGSYMLDLLLEKGYKVYGVARRVSTNNTHRIAAHLDDPNFLLLNGDVTDSVSVNKIISELKADEIYNYAAQSHVHVSWQEPVSTIQSVSLGCLYCLEAIRLYSPASRYFYAASSEEFGYQVDKDGYQRIDTPLVPNSPYAAAKVLAHNLVKIYRDSYKLWACVALSANHESPRRGENFVTRKVTKYIGQIEKPDVLPINYKTSTTIPRLIKKLKLGNLSAQRDWSHARDIVEAHYLMMQRETPKDYVVSSGETHTVQEFVEKAFAIRGKPWKAFVEIDAALFRPVEVPYLKLDSTPIREELGWKPQIDFQELIKIMVDHDVAEARNE